MRVSSACRHGGWDALSQTGIGQTGGKLNPGTILNSRQLTSIILMFMNFSWPGKPGNRNSGDAFTEAPGP